MEDERSRSTRWEQRRLFVSTNNQSATGSLGGGRKYSDAVVRQLPEQHLSPSQLRKKSGLYSTSTSPRAFSAPSVSVHAPLRMPRAEVPSSSRLSRSTVPRHRTLPENALFDVDYLGASEAGVRSSFAVVNDQMSPDLAAREDC
jgi:hypothetical protein